jgi:hypothetical protein
MIKLFYLRAYAKHCIFYSHEDINFMNTIRQVLPRV